MPKITIYDIATEAGISASSVSRILRGGDGHIYPEATCQRVLEAARRLGYRPNAAARLLSQSTPTMIGVAVHFTEHPYLNRFLAAVHKELLKHQYDIAFIDSQHLSDEEASPPFPPPHMLAGFISPGWELQRGWPRHYADIRKYVPIVALQPISKEAAKWVDVVQVDFSDAYMQVGAYLQQRGHQHIAYLGGISQLNPSESNKHQGWRAAMKKLKLSAEYKIPWIADNQPQTSSAQDNSNDYLYHPSSRRAMEHVMAQLQTFPQRITALICSSDEVAIGFQSYLQSQGWKLPDDLSIIGYDGISMGECVYPSLTTIAPDYEHMAQAAVDQLLTRMEQKRSNGMRAKTQSISPRLLIRNSVSSVST